jgi:hypothetical protein
MILLMRTLLNVPTLVPAGPRNLAPSLRKNGALRMSRMVTPAKVMSSIGPPSTVSSAKPRQVSNTQLVIVMFLNPPFDSVPHLIRPVGCPALASVRLKVPSSIAPSAKPPVR